MKYFVIFAIMFGPFNAFGIQTNEYSACLANTREHLADIDRMSLAYLQEGPAYTNSISPNEELARNIVLDELSTQHSYASRRRGQLLSQTVEKYKNVLAAGDMTQIHILAKEILESKIKSIVSDTSYSFIHYVRNNSDDLEALLTIYRGNFKKYEAMLSRLNSEQSVPGYPPQGVGSPDP